MQVASSDFCVRLKLMFIINFILGLCIICAGALGIRFNYQIVNSFGRNNVFERRLGPGSTYPVFQLFAIVTILTGLLVMFGLHTRVLDVLLSPLVNLFSA